MLMWSFYRGFQRSRLADTVDLFLPVIDRVISWGSTALVRSVIKHDPAELRAGHHPRAVLKMVSAI